MKVGELLTFTPKDGGKRSDPPTNHGPTHNGENKMADDHGHGGDHGKGGHDKKHDHGKSGDHGHGKAKEKDGMGNPKNLFLLVLVGIFAIWVVTKVVPFLFSEGIDGYSVVGCKFSGRTDCEPPPASRFAPANAAATDGSNAVAPPAFAPPPARQHQYGGRERRVVQKPPVVRKRMIDGPQHRGSAERYCMRQNPHWAQMMERRADCQISGGHGSDRTKCNIRCG